MHFWWKYLDTSFLYQTISSLSIYSSTQSKCDFFHSTQALELALLGTALRIRVDSSAYPDLFSPCQKAALGRNSVSSYVDSKPGPLELEINACPFGYRHQFQ